MKTPEQINAEIKKLFDMYQSDESIGGMFGAAIMNGASQALAWVLSDDNKAVSEIVKSKDLEL